MFYDVFSSIKIRLGHILDDTHIQLWWQVQVNEVKYDSTLFVFPKRCFIHLFFVGGEYFLVQVSTWQCLESKLTMLTCPIYSMYEGFSYIWLKFDGKCREIFQSHRASLDMFSTHGGTSEVRPFTTEWFNIPDGKHHMTRKPSHSIEWSSRCVPSKTMWFFWWCDIVWLNRVFFDYRWIFSNSHIATILEGKNHSQNMWFQCFLWLFQIIIHVYMIIYIYLDIHTYHWNTDWNSICSWNVNRHMANTQTLLV